MGTESAVDRARIAKDFAEVFGKKLDAMKLTSITNSITANTTPYAANGSIAAIVIWDRVQVTINDGKTFDGDAWGLGGIGGGALIGTVYTADINALYANTRRFQVTATPVYTSVVFLDENSAALGTFQAGSVSTVTAVSGGSGSWS
jgi:hypothetical protein